MAAFLSSCVLNKKENLTFRIPKSFLPTFPHFPNNQAEQNFDPFFSLSITRKTLKPKSQKQSKAQLAWPLDKESGIHIADPQIGNIKSPGFPISFSHTSNPKPQFPLRNSISTPSVEGQKHFSRKTNLNQDLTFCLYAEKQECVQKMERLKKTYIKNKIEINEEEEHLRPVVAGRCFVMCSCCCCFFFLFAPFSLPSLSLLCLVGFRVLLVPALLDWT